MAGIRVLISKGLLSGPETEAFCRQDEYLEKATFLGLITSALLFLLMIAVKSVFSL